jgi:hypothetical protein
MAQQTTMTVYRDVVLECQHCYMICRYSEAAVRRNCPACGRAIGNWHELTDALQAQTPTAPQHPLPVEPGTDTG